MHEETIAGLRKIAQDYKGRLTPYMRLTICKAANAIEDLENKLNLWRQDKISRWIPVTEALPDDGVKVICISKNGRVSDCDCLKSYVTKFGNYDMATHWMPFSAPPIQPVSKTDEFEKAEQLGRRSKEET